MNPIFRLFELAEAQRIFKLAQQQIDTARTMFPDDDEFQEMLNQREATIAQQLENVRIRMFTIASSN